MSVINLDEIGRWSEIKLDIIAAYAKSYSQILANQPSLYHIYIDGFAGAGMHVSKESREPIAGSPLNVANVEPPFRECHLVEINPRKVEHLRQLFSKDPKVRIYSGDCNEVLPSKILPSVRYEDYRRALCLLDPYGLHLDWKVIFAAGQLGTVDLLLNFPTMDMNMNVLRRDSTAVTAEQRARLSRYWGDESWKDIAYTSEEGLFGPIEEKSDNEVVAAAFASRLTMVAGFKHVIDPIPMRNSSNAIVYYLFFASQSSTGARIMKHIFDKYRARGVK